MSERISIANLEKAAVLAALYNAAHPQGLGFLHYDATPMTSDEARKKYGSCDGYYDYLQGRVMKVDLSEDSFDPWLYDRDNGPGSAKRAIDALKNDGDTNPIETMVSHQLNTLDAAKEAKEATKESSGLVSESEGFATYKLGLGDFSEALQKPLQDVLGEEKEDEE